MSRTLVYLLLLASAMFFVGCDKDVLTVEDIGTSGHACAMVVIPMNIDSLTHLGPDAELDVDLCDCDSLSLRPVNIPSDLTFVHWTVHQGEEHEDHEDLELDTITVDSELDLIFQHQNTFFIHVPVRVHVAPC